MRSTTVRAVNMAQLDDCDVECIFQPVAPAPSRGFRAAKPRNPRSTISDPMAAWKGDSMQQPQPAGAPSLPARRPREGAGDHAGMRHVRLHGKTESHHQIVLCPD